MKGKGKEGKGREGGGHTTPSREDREKERGAFISLEWNKLVQKGKQIHCCVKIKKRKGSIYSNPKKTRNKQKRKEKAILGIYFFTSLPLPSITIL